MLRSRFASWISAWAVGLILIVSVAPGAVAQDPAVKEAPQPKAAKPADAESKSKAESKPRWGEASADASGKPTRPPRAIGVDDAENWPVLRSARLSNDGVWFGFIEGPGSGDSTFVLRRADGTGEPVRIDVGTRGSFTFSENSQWVGVIVGPTEAEAERARKSKKPAERKLELFRADAPGQRRTFDNIASFAFSGESSAWVAVRKASAGGGAGRGGDLVLHELATERQLGIGNVGSFAFDDAGERLAWTVEAADDSLNGVQIRTLATGVVAPLASGKSKFQRLSWTEEGDALTVLEATDHDDYEEPLVRVHGFRDFGRGEPKSFVYDPAKDAAFPEGMTVSPNRTATWSEDRKSILFGIHEVEKKDDGKSKDGKGEDDASPPRGRGGRPGGGGDDEKPDVVIWHWQDARLQSQQQVEASRDRNRSDLCVYRVDDDKMLRIGDDEVRGFNPTEGERFAIAQDRKPYDLQTSLDGIRLADVYVADLATGKRRLALKGNRWMMGASPDGTRFLYFQDGHYHVYEMATGETYAITKDAPVSFIDVEDDHNVENPPIRPIGWVKGGASVLLSDAWDIWHVPAHGGAATNLTVNGKEDRLRYRRRFRLDPDEEGIDLTGAMYIGVFGEDTKRNAIGRIDGGKPGVTVLASDSPNCNLAQKAEDADVYLWSTESSTAPREYFAGGPDLKDGKQLTDAAATHRGWFWSDGAQIVKYESTTGKPLTAALFRPANYIEGKSYPTIVYIYETLSQRMHSYSTPRTGGFSPSLYASQGYAVLMPDIVYRVNDPGLSSVECVLPALDAAIATTVVDPEKVGLHGHSWGGYQTAFLITQTDRFAAAVSGAPLTNLISMYSSIYWNSGRANQPIFESSQGRFTGGYWENLEAYARNSPVYHAENVTTPLLLLHNDKDGAVDWNQGIEYFNTLRRLGKAIVMLQYVGENHGLRQDPNRKDYSERMLEFFAHYLRGKDAPDWWKEGIEHLDHEDHIEARTSD